MVDKDSWSICYHCVMGFLRRFGLLRDENDDFKVSVSTKNKMSKDEFCKTWMLFWEGEIIWGCPSCQDLCGCDDVEDEYVRKSLHGKLDGYPKNAYGLNKSKEDYPPNGCPYYLELLLLEKQKER